MGPLAIFAIFVIFIMISLAALGFALVVARNGLPPRDDRRGGRSHPLPLREALDRDYAVLAALRTRTEQDAHGITRHVGSALTERASRGAAGHATGEDAAAEERPLERAITVDAAATKARDLAGRVQ